MNDKKDTDYETFIKDETFCNIDLTNKCNLGCTQCMRYALEDPNLRGTDKHKRIQDTVNSSYDISLQDLHKLIDFFNKISYCGNISDPIFYKWFDELLEISKNYPKKRFQIHTAASQKNFAWYKKHLDNTPKNTKWIFGLDGLPDTSFNYRRRQNSQLVYDAMIYGAEHNVRVVWQFIVFPYNEHQIETAKKIAEQYKMGIWFVYSNRDENGKILDKEIKRIRYDFA